MGKAVKRLLQLAALLPLLCGMGWGACSNTSLSNGVTCIQSAAANQSVSSTTLSVTISSSTAGSLLYVATLSNFNAVTGCTDNKGQTYTHEITPGVYGSAWYFPNSASGVTSITCTWGSADTLESEIAAEFSGIGTSPFDTANACSGASACTTAGATGGANWSSMAVTPTSGQTELIIGFINDQTSTNDITGGSNGFTLLQTSPYAAHGIDFGVVAMTVASTSGSYKASGTATNATYGAIGVGFYKASGGASTPKTFPVVAREYAPDSEVNNGRH